MVVTPCVVTARWLWLASRRAAKLADFGQSHHPQDRERGPC